MKKNAGCEFFLGRRATRVTRLTVAVFGVALAWHAWLAYREYGGRGIGAPWELAALAAFADGLFAAYCARALARASRFVFRVGDREIEWGSAFALSGRRRRLPLDAIRSLAWQTPKRLRLETREGGAIVLRLAEIDAEDRRAVFEAIRQRISPAPPPAGPGGP